MTVVPFPRHRLVRDCARPDTCGGTCWVCAGLACCTTCGGAEASLPSDCPQRRLTDWEADAVQVGTLDYSLRDGWRGYAQIVCT